jgi:hypothetical protein
MTDILMGVRRAVLGLSVGLLAAALVVEVPSRVLADGYLAGPCPNPKTPTGCGTPPDCNNNDCTAPGGAVTCNCNSDVLVCPCVQS